MNIKSSLSLAFLFTCAVFQQLHAQEDVVYLKNNSKKIGKVVSISQDKVEFQPGLDAKSEKILKSELELILFENGSYITLPSDYKGLEGPVENRHSEDWILTKEERIVECVIENAETNLLKVSAMGDSGKKDFSIPKSDIAGILFANGKKQLLGSSPALVAEILRKKQVQAPLEFLGKYQAKKEQAKKAFDGKLELDRVSQEQLQKRGLQKVDDLGKYLNLVANKSTEAAVSSKAVDQAVALFLSDSSIVETKRPNGERKQEYVRNYLTKLRLLKYSKVVIAWSDISYVSNLRKGPDGNYYGVISIQQKFTGYIDNKPVFADVTTKNIEVVLKTYRKEVDGESLELWDVFLNNIGISESKS